MTRNEYLNLIRSSFLNRFGMVLVFTAEGLQDFFSIKDVNDAEQQWADLKTFWTQTGCVWYYP